MSLICKWILIVCKSVDTPMLGILFSTRSPLNQYIYVKVLRNGVETRLSLLTNALHRYRCVYTPAYMLVCIQMHRLGLESHQGASTLPKQYTILYSKRDTSKQDVSTDVLGGLGRYKHVTQV